MIGFLPKRPGGTDPEARFMQWVWDTLSSLRMIQVTGSKTCRTTRGFYSIPNDGSGDSSAAGDYRLKSVQGDYITARAWDGTNDGAVDIYIAKPYRLRQSLATITEFGIAYTFSYANGPGTGADSTNNQYRTKAGGGDSEQELVTPVWVVDEIISAIPYKTNIKTAAPTAPVNKPVSLLMVGPDRQWAEQ